MDAPILPDPFCDLSAYYVNDLYWELTKQGARKGSDMTRLMKLIGLMRQENDELRLRVGVLLRLLIKQGVISAEQVTVAIAEAKASVGLAQTQAQRPAVTKPGRNAPKPKPGK